jgi:hypothetical protein
MRSYLSLFVAKLDGIIVRDLVRMEKVFVLYSPVTLADTTSFIFTKVSANLKGFGMGLVYWFALAIPSTYTNSMVIRNDSFPLLVEDHLFADPEFIDTLSSAEASCFVPYPFDSLRSRPLSLR